MRGYIAYSTQMERRVRWRSTARSTPRLSARQACRGRMAPHRPLPRLPLSFGQWTSPSVTMASRPLLSVFDGEAAVEQASGAGSMWGAAWRPATIPAACGGLVNIVGRQHWPVGAGGPPPAQHRSAMQRFQALAGSLSWHGDCLSAVSTRWTGGSSPLGSGMVPSLAPRALGCCQRSEQLSHDQRRENAASRRQGRCRLSPPRLADPLAAYLAGRPAQFAWQSSCVG